MEKKLMNKLDEMELDISFCLHEGTSFVLFHNGHNAYFHIKAHFFLSEVLTPLLKKCIILLVFSNGVIAQLVRVSR